MSFQAMTWATEQEVPAMQKIVLLMMANRMNHDTGLCCPSHDTLAKECGMTKRSLIDQIKKLEELGYISVIRTKTDKKINVANKYILHVSRKINSEPDSLGGSEPRSLGSEPDSLGGSEPRSPKPVNIKPVIEPKDNVGTSIEAPTTSKKAKAKKEPTQSEIDALKVAEYLAKKITSYNSEAKVNPKSWIKDIDKAIRIDNRDPKELCEIIQWIYAEGTFWIPNILSGKALREKYNQLSMQRKANKTNVHPINQPRSQMLAGVRFGNF